MGKKFIIELPENTHWIQWLMEGTEDNHPYMDFKSVEDLTPYTAPDLDAIRKKAYHDGYFVGNENLKDLIHEKEETAYQRGMEDAWKAARKIALSVNFGGMKASEVKEMFGVDWQYVLMNCTPATAIEKIRQYKHEKEEEQIRVGDEMEWAGDMYVVTYIDSECKTADMICAEDGSVVEEVYYENCRKTGRHFPEIVSILQKMKQEI